MPRKRRRRSTNGITNTASKKPKVHEEEIEDRLFVNPSHIPEPLFCPICTEVFDCPMRLPCGHSFCDRVACPYRGLGCSETMSLTNLKIHKKECLFNPDSMPESIREIEKKRLKEAESAIINSVPKIVNLPNLDSDDEDTKTEANKGF